MWLDISKMPLTINHPPPPREVLQPRCAATALLRPLSPQAVAGGSSGPGSLQGRDKLSLVALLRSTDLPPPWPPLRRHPSHQAPSMLPSQDDLDADAIKRLPFILHQRVAAKESDLSGHEKGLRKKHSM
ncbi:hypothetical protein DEO72_LG5g2476 [Vigna unguiculata]|uniref:Uncharacterized protein n=1 Tax=Vigna unguiculata TaxID=3917 RepID=A0A4D6M0V3_VIGUN|nr:hypothetical protein DEO72_LG5g2476 [Vigna unguiculata]